MKTYEELLKHVASEKHVGEDSIPSASGMEYYKLCPGRFLACGHFVDTETANKEHRLRGCAGHWLVKQALEKKEVTYPDGTPEDLIEAVNWVLFKITELLEDGWNIKEVECYHKKDYLTGTPDLVIEKDGNILVVDFKFGRLEVPEDTMQLTSYLDLLEQEEGFGLILQPFDRSHNIHKFTKEDIEDVKDYALACVSENAMRSVSQYCKYCIACATDKCKESGSAVEKISSEGKELVGAPPEHLVVMAKTVSGICDKILDAAKEKMKEDNSFYDAIELKPGNKVRFVGSVAGAIAKAKEVGIGKDLYSALTLSVSKLENIFIAMHNDDDTPKKELKAKFNEAFYDIIKEKQNAPSLKIKKGSSI